MKAHQIEEKLEHDGRLACIIRIAFRKVCQHDSDEDLLPKDKKGPCLRGPVPNVIRTRVQIHIELSPPGKRKEVNGKARSLSADVLVRAGCTYRDGCRTPGMVNLSSFGRHTSSLRSARFATRSQSGPAANSPRKAPMNPREKAKSDLRRVKLEATLPRN